MGIKFDILSDIFLLAEDSEFSKFFTNVTPIKIIHNQLKVAHDTKLVLSQTNNRHELWDALREGKAVFAVMNQPQSIRQASAGLQDAVRRAQPPANRGRSYNEIRDAARRFTAAVAGKQITSKDFKEIEQRIKGTATKRGILSMVDELYPSEPFLRDAFKEFIGAIRPGSYVLVKRIPFNQRKNGGLSLRPSQREFPERPEEDRKQKVFGQEYSAWIFSGDALIEQKYFKVNAVTVFNELFPGVSTNRDFYIVDNEQFLRLKKHPFIPGAGVQFQQILPVDQTSITTFAKGNLLKYEKIIAGKIKTSAEGIKQKAISDTHQQGVPVTDVTASVEEYRKALSILNQGIKQVDPVPVFNNFLLKDTGTNLNDYMIINAEKPFNAVDPYRATDPHNTQQVQKSQEDWQIMTKKEGIPIIQNLLRSGVPVRKEHMVTVRSKKDRKAVSNVEFKEMLRRPELEQYEMWDPDQKQWVAFDPQYIENHKVLSGPQYAIAFKTLKEYNDFSRRFVLFAMRSIIREPEAKQLETLLADI